MNTIDRYLAKTVLLSTVMVLLVLVALDRLFAFVGHLDDLDKGAYNLNELLINMALHIPGSIYGMMTTAAVLGALLGLGALAKNSELIIVRSAGMSLARVARPLVIVGSVLAIALFAMGEWLVPQSEEYASQLRMKAMSKEMSIEGGSGLWLREGDRYINVRRVLPGFNLRGISVYEYKRGTLVKLVRAGSANYDEILGWQLTQVETSSFDGAAVTVDKRVSVRQRTLLNPEMLRALSLQTEMLSARDLYENIRYLEENKLQTAVYELAFWSKFSLPLSTVIMSLIALPFALGSQRQASGGQRIFIGSLIGIGFLLISKVSSQLGLVMGVHGAIGAFFPIVLLVGVGVLGLRRVD